MLMAFTFDRKSAIYMAPEQGEKFAPQFCTLASLPKGFCIAKHYQSIPGARKEDIEALR